ncbi:MAG: BldC family transcriptional regulator, partial [Nocardioides sp.]|nr:BldC family transcriptional regulator [Nocardioides sp.]
MVLHPESQDELLTPAGVAALLYVDPKTVTRWAAAGKLAAVRTPGGHRRYLRSEVLAIVSGLHPDHPDRDPSRDNSQDSVMVDSERQAAAAAVVAEAVALALEAAAAEAAEAVLVTAAGVTEA